MHPQTQSKTQGKECSARAARAAAACGEGLGRGRTSPSPPGQRGSQEPLGHAQPSMFHPGDTPQETPGKGFDRCNRGL